MCVCVYVCVCDGHLNKEVDLGGNDMKWEEQCILRESVLVTQ